MAVIVLRTSDGYIVRKSVFLLIEGIEKDVGNDDLNYVWLPNFSLCCGITLYDLARVSTMMSINMFTFSIVGCPIWNTNIWSYQCICWMVNLLKRLKLICQLFDTNLLCYLTETFRSLVELLICIWVAALLNLYFVCFPSVFD